MRWRHPDHLRGIETRRTLATRRDRAMNRRRAPRRQTPAIGYGVRIIVMARRPRPIGEPTNACAPPFREAGRLIDGGPASGALVPTVDQ
jgi:hypothetical protein